ncbi:MAG: hypothetical protein ACLTZY_16030 [Alistipes indistinctus]
MVWNAIGIARGSNGDDEQIDEMLEKAYRKGYKKAMEEMHEGYGERGGYSGGGRGGYRVCVSRGKKTMTTTMTMASVVECVEPVRILATDVGRLWTDSTFTSRYRGECVNACLTTDGISRKSSRQYATDPKAHEKRRRVVAPVDARGGRRRP